MAGHRLKLNQCKTQIIPIGTWQQTSRLQINSVLINNANIDLCSIATILGFTFDKHMTMNDHVKNVTSSCSMHLRRLRMIKRFLNRSTLECLVHAFVHSKLDYYNSLLYGISNRSRFKLQSIQNQASKLIDGGLKFDHVTPILRKLHWLIVDKRIVFKIAVHVFRCLNGQAPQYLVGKCTPKICKSINYGLRSNELNFLIIPPTRLTTGSRDFPVVGPAVWNSLPWSLRKPGLVLPRFKKDLKTYLFSL